MLGAINELIKEVIVRDYSDEVWSQIKSKTNLNEDIFLSFQEYPDTITFSVIKQFEEITKQDPDKLLFDVGKYCIEKYTSDGISAGLATGGQTFEDYIINMPEMNERTKLLTPDRISSEMSVKKVNDREYEITIESKITGFNHLIKGVLISIGKILYGEKVNVNIAESKNKTINVFYVKW